MNYVIIDISKQPHLPEWLFPLHNLFCSIEGKVIERKEDIEHLVDGLERWLANKRLSLSYKVSHSFSGQRGVICISRIDEGIEDNIKHTTEILSLRYLRLAENVVASDLDMLFEQYTPQAKEGFRVIRKEYISKRPKWLTSFLLDVTPSVYERRETFEEARQNLILITEIVKDCDIIKHNHKLAIETNENEIVIKSRKGNIFLKFIIQQFND